MNNINSKSYHTTVVVMCRNEEDRIHEFMQHCCYFFDRIILIDHLSEDNTSKIAVSYNGLNNTQVIIFKGTDEGYYQSQYMSACANALLREQKTDWIFFLDIDEFLSFKNIEEYYLFLNSMKDAQIVKMHWLNVALERTCGLTWRRINDIVALFKRSHFTKIALNVKLLKGIKIVIHQGNHSASIENNNNSLIIKESSYDIFHIPITDFSQISKKVSTGTLALTKTVGLDKGAGFHWREMNENLKKIKNKYFLKIIALNYSMQIQKIFDNYDEFKNDKSIIKGTLHFKTIDMNYCGNYKLNPAKCEMIKVCLDNINEVISNAIINGAKSEVVSGDKICSPSDQ